MNRITRLSLGLGVLAMLGTAAAQPPLPSSSALSPALQQQQLLESRRYYEQRQSAGKSQAQGPLIKGSVPAGGKLPTSNATFQLQAIHFNASAFIDASTLQAIADDYVGTVVSFADINALVARINAVYAERGIVTARAIVPPQKIQDGMLEIRLVEGRLGQLQVKGNSYINAAYFENRLPLQTGTVIDVPELRDALRFVNRTSQARAQVALSAGADTGETDVILNIDEPPRYSFQAFANNNGSESTGKLRGGVSVGIYSLLGRDDQLTLLAVGSKGSLNGLIQYSLPVNLHGARLSFRYVNGQVDVVDGPFEALDITGDSSQASIGINVPWLRTPTFGLESYLHANYIRSATEISSVELSEYSVLRFDGGVRLSGFGDGYQWSVRQGLSSAQVENTFGERNNYWLAEGDGSFSMLFTDNWLGVVRGGWQYASEEALPSPLLFQIGGVSIVRGYPQGILSGARGYFISLETQYRFNQYLTPYVFADHGMVDGVNEDGETITSVGLGLRWQYGDHLAGEIAWGQALEKVEPDQDSGAVHVRVSYSWSGF